MLGDERRGVEEGYTSASNSSNLRVVADRRGDADMFIAAGWCQSRLGMALLRLHSEWDRAEKPQRVAASAGAAATRCTDLQQREYALLLGRLRALPGVRDQLQLVLVAWGIDAAADKGSAVLRFWLDQNCQACHGLKWQKVPSAPALSNRVCRTCRGAGVAAVPHGEEGKRIANFLDDCVQRARKQIARRLRNSEIRV